LALAKKIGWNVVAEGIETEAAAEHLRNLGCQYGQGFLFAKPMSGRDILTLVRLQNTKTA
jgi:EAL domain-containing protein (putative c-di-GMP-specific phosphodiesterase class I)